MDYEKKYKEALEWARKVMQGKVGFVLDEVLEKFPELKESEDEKMIKFIKQQLFNIKKTITENYELDARLTKAIDWLESQGEHANFRNKIQIGDKVTRNQDGVLVNLSQLKRVAKPAEKYGEQKPVDKDEQKGTNIVEEDMTPFQKKVFCIIDTAIEEEQGLKQVCDELLRLAHDEIMQKSAWSEEDETELTNTIIMLKEGASLHFNKKDITKAVDWLKSLKDRVQPKQEWSEEDEQYLLVCKNALVKYQTTDKWDATIILRWLEDKLKSLRPKTAWKPSDEHYELEEFAKIVRGNLTGISKAVQKLFEAKYLQLTGDKMYGGFKD